MRPDTWLPTCTVTSADTVPVAVTRAVIRPRSTLTVSYLVSGRLFERAYANTAPPMAKSARTAMSQARAAFMGVGGGVAARLVVAHRGPRASPWRLAYTVFQHSSGYAGRLAQVPQENVGNGAAGLAKR